MLFAVNVTIIINNKFVMPGIFENIIEFPLYSNHFKQTTLCSLFQEGHK